MKYRIDEVELNEVLKPYNLEYKEGTIYGQTENNSEYKVFTFDIENGITKFNDDLHIMAIKYKQPNSELCSSSNLLIPILCPHFDKIFKELRTKVSYHKCAEFLKNYGFTIKFGSVRFEQYVSDYGTRIADGYADLNEIINKLNGGRLKDEFNDAENILYAILLHHKEELSEEE